MTEPVREIDAFHGRLIRLLASCGLEMHTPMRGPSYVTQKGPARRRVIINGRVRFTSRDIRG